MATPGGLGRREPKSWEHVDQHRLMLALPPPAVVEKILDPRTDRWSWADADQGATSACTGFGATRLATMLHGTDAPYDPWWQWNQNKIHDGLSDTNPGDDNGSTVHAACWVLQHEGPSPKRGPITASPVKKDGIASVAWTMSTSAIRTCISANIPVLIGINWYEGFDTPVVVNGDQWCGRGNLGSVRGGHCLVIGGWSDKRNAVLLYNSWGSWGPCYLSVPVLSRLIREGGEFAVVTDRIPIVKPTPPAPVPTPPPAPGPAPIPPPGPGATRQPPAGAVSVTPATIFQTDANVLLMEDGQYPPFHVTNPGTVLFARNIGGAVVVGGKAFSSDEDPCSIRVNDNCDGFNIDGVAMRGSPGRGLFVTHCQQVAVRNVESSQHAIEGGLLSGCPGAVLEDCYAHDSRNGDDRSHGLYVSGDCSGTIIRRLKAERCSGSGLQLNSASLGFHAENIVVEDVSLSECGSDGTPALSMMGISNSTLRRFNFQGNNAGMVCFSDGQGEEYACRGNRFEDFQTDGAGKFQVHELEGSGGNVWVRPSGFTVPDGDTEES